MTWPLLSDTFPLVVPFITMEAPTTGPNESSTIHVTFPFCWEMLTFCFTGAVSAQAPPGTAKVPVSKMAFTKIDFFNIEL